MHLLNRRFCQWDLPICIVRGERPIFGDHGPYEHEGCIERLHCHVQGSYDRSALRKYRFLEVILVTEARLTELISGVTLVCSWLVPNQAGLVNESLRN